MKLQLQASLTLSNIEVIDRPGYCKDVFDRKLRELIADQIRQFKSVEIHHKFHTEHRLDVLVATQDEFWELVHKEAERIAYMMRMPQSHGPKTLTPYDEGAAP